MLNSLYAIKQKGHKHLLKIPTIMFEDSLCIANFQQKVRKLSTSTKDLFFELISCNLPMSFCADMDLSTLFLHDAQSVGLLNIVSTNSGHTYRGTSSTTLSELSTTLSAWVWAASTPLMVPVPTDPPFRGSVVLSLCACVTFCFCLA